MPEGWRESLDPFAPMLANEDPLAAKANAAKLTGEFAARCAAIDAQLRHRLPNDVELKFLAGIGAWSARLQYDISKAVFEQTIAGIPVEIAPNTSFTTL